MQAGTNQFWFPAPTRPYANYGSGFGWSSGLFLYLHLYELYLKSIYYDLFNVIMPIFISDQLIIKQKFEGLEAVGNQFRQLKSLIKQSLPIVILKLITKPFCLNLCQSVSISSIVVNVFISAFVDIRITYTVFKYSKNHNT